MALWISRRHEVFKKLSSSDSVIWVHCFGGFLENDFSVDIAVTVIRLELLLKTSNIVKGSKNV